MKLKIDNLSKTYANGVRALKDISLELTNGMTLELAGVRLIVDHAPGHTPGSVAFRLAADETAGSGQIEPSPIEHSGALFTGDLLFAGSIGRTDLPGGDYPTILDSLARVCLIDRKSVV